MIIVPIKNEDKKIIEHLHFKVGKNKIEGHYLKYHSKSEFLDKNLSNHHILSDFTGRLEYRSLDSDAQYVLEYWKGGSLEGLCDGHTFLNPKTCNICHTEIDGVVIVKPPQPVPLPEIPCHFCPPKIEDPPFLYFSASIFTS